MLSGAVAPTVCSESIVMHTRWLGHGTMVILTIHGWGFWALWLWEGTPMRALTWDPHGSNMLAGAIAWVCGAALWVTATAYVRRNYFEVGHSPIVCVSIPAHTTNVCQKT